ncbi:MAG: hypothetical protein JXQ68_05925 [Campylobacterales bacterium]|nr:hypothetical protein [Campylobacterales bacterium]
MTTIYIEDFSYFLTDQNRPTKEIKKELELKNGKKYRRINRYIILALAGVYNMNDIENIESNCALHIGTRNGCITETIDMLDQVHNNSLLPMPFTFIASSTNMVNYHIAQSLQLHGGNFTISNRHSPFSIALDGAYFDIKNKKNSSALIGCIDEIALPLDKFKEKIEISNKKLQEGSFWVRLSTQKENAKAIMQEPQRYKNIEDALKHIEENRSIYIDDEKIRSNDKDSYYLCSNSSLQALQCLEKKECKKIAIISRIGEREYLSFSIDSLR